MTPGDRGRCRLRGSRSAACACQISPSTFTCPSGASEVMASPTVPIIVCTPTCRLAAPAVANAEEPETELEHGGERDHEQGPRPRQEDEREDQDEDQEHAASRRAVHLFVTRSPQRCPRRRGHTSWNGSDARAWGMPVPVQGLWQRRTSAGTRRATCSRSGSRRSSSSSTPPRFSRPRRSNRCSGRVRDPRVTAEFRAAQVELVSPVGVTVADLRCELAATRAAVVGALGGQGEAARGGDAPDVERPGADHRPAPLPADRRRAPVGAAARPAERAPRPRRASATPTRRSRSTTPPAATSRSSPRSPPTRRSSRGATRGSPRPA